jgi:hypothetical protein
VDISGFLFPTGEYIYRESGKIHSDMFGEGELSDVRTHQEMYDRGILRIGYIGHALMIDGASITPNQRVYIKKLIRHYRTRIRSICLEIGENFEEITREDFLCGRSQLL